MGFSRIVAKNLQKTAKTIEEANARFSLSCTICCNDPKCLWQESCDRCMVAAIHREKIKDLRESKGVILC